MEDNEDHAQHDEAADEILDNFAGRRDHGRLSEHAKRSTGVLDDAPDDNGIYIKFAIRSNLSRQANAITSEPTSHTRHDTSAHDTPTTPTQPWRSRRVVARELDIVTSD
ncbi:hypothetical protein LTR62_003956 [Meristemomyces frigidus]|uniref:Uncharacterized protein n=1 Tax=Meristemomyces frigidus TaxID=1508187 RepID=A0AAN7TJA2_9PEZI|nr:hypothetical protein LTR62_003956 [Meristemomyces frigidus]